MNDLTAVNVLVAPDATTARHAHAWNARMRAGVPDGFTLDASSGRTSPPSSATSGRPTWTTCTRPSG
ncbi:hypothetical protein GCM10025734_06700 [Kitasatospora paranensis]|uniref:hypothetical protein n=1 Tax=Kitasatospora paranensis TaxID=258053 RepID=UPI0031E50337